MQIVIDIDEKLYNRIKYLEPKADTMLDSLMRSVQNGTPLPKGHGRLIDADALADKEEYWSSDETESFFYVYSEDIAYAPTILEEDKEAKNE